VQRRLEHGATEPAPVAQGQAAAVLELEHEAVPALGGRLAVDRDRARHAQVQPEHGAVVVGLHPHRLALSVGGDEPVAVQRRREVPGGMGAAHVRVAIVDVDDPPAQGALLDRLPGTLDLWQLGHGRVPLPVAQAATRASRPRAGGGR
jgi:hypothetical protein